MFDRGIQTFIFNAMLLKKCPMFSKPALVNFKYYKKTNLSFSREVCLQSKFCCVKVRYFNILFFFYYLMISISSFLEAARAGIQPKTMPINDETPTASKIEPSVTELLI